MASSGKFSDLVEYVDWSSVECLNQKPGQEIGNALKQDHRDDDSLFLESDTDEQLLIFVPFNQNVKLGELVLKSTEKASGPLKVKVFVNRHSMGFDQASGEPATQEFELTEKQLEGEPVPLRLVPLPPSPSLPTPHFHCPLPSPFPLRFPFHLHHPAT